MSKHDKYNVIDAGTCQVCNGEFTRINYKVRDHCHSTGSYRGAAHAICNIKYYYTRYVPVVFQNLRGYDAH